MSHSSAENNNLIDLKQMEKDNYLNKYNKVYSFKYGLEGVDLILENNMSEAYDRISKALQLNDSNCINYLNRCYCCLRLRKYDQALQDADFVLKNSTVHMHLFIANLRAGQASEGLKNFHEAESYLNAATVLNPENLGAKRELMRVKVMRLKYLGFQEKDALLALDTYLHVGDALFYLIRSNAPRSIYKTDEDFSNVDDLVYSSDEDEKPNNVEILNNMLKYKPGSVKLQHIATKPSAERFSKVVEEDNESSLPKFVKEDDQNSLLKSVCNEYSINKKGVWVGNLPFFVSDRMLMSVFNLYGEVETVYRPENAQYAFINFKTAEDVSKVLNFNNYEIAGIKLAVRQAKVKNL